MVPRDHDGARGPRWGQGTMMGHRDHNGIPVTRDPRTTKSLGTTSGPGDHMGAEEYKEVWGSKEGPRDHK